jgi:hypothetical protein
VTRNPSTENAAHFERFSHFIGARKHDAGVPSDRGLRDFKESRNINCFIFVDAIDKRRGPVWNKRFN